VKAVGKLPVTPFFVRYAMSGSIGHFSVMATIAAK
jgi:hypothetical protein